MRFVANDEPKPQPAPTVAAVSGELFAATEPKPVPELRFIDGEGQPRTLVDFRGKAVLLNLWAALVSCLAQTSTVRLRFPHLRLALNQHGS